MSDQLESELNRLADEGAHALTQQPAVAAQKFELAHDLALRLGQGSTAASLSALIARSWHLRGSIVQCLRFSRRAVREAPNTSDSHYTLGHFCEKAAVRAARSGKDRRAISLFLAARSAFSKAGELNEEPGRRTNLEAAAEECSRAAQRLITDCSQSASRDE
jgi:hypothetical protein